jgi:hypothetical protein
MTAAGGAVYEDNAHSNSMNSNTNFSPNTNSDAPLPHLLLERQLSDSSTASSSALSSARSPDSSSTSGQFLLPIPNPGGNKSQSSFSMSDDENSVMQDPLPPEIANADISIARESRVSLRTSAFSDPYNYRATSVAFDATLSRLVSLTPESGWCGNSASHCNPTMPKYFLIAFIA